MKPQKNSTKGPKRGIVKDIEFIILIFATVLYNLFFLKGVRTINYAFINEIFKSKLIEFFFTKVLYHLSPIFFIVNNLASLIFILLFYYITKEIFKNNKIAFYSSLMVLISPIYVFLFSSINHFFVFTILFLLGFLLKLKNQNILGSIFLIFSSFNYLFLILTLILILYFDVGRKNKSVLIFDFAALGIYSYYVFFRSFFDLKMAYYPIASITELLFELSYFLSVRLIVFILSIIAVVWLSYKKEFRFLDSLLLILISVSLLFSYLSKYSIIIGAILLNMFAGVGIYHLIYNKYSNSLFKVLILGLLFVLIAFPQPILVVKNLEKAHRFNEILEIINENQNRLHNLIVSPNEVCIYSIVGGKNAFFSDNLCSDFYESNNEKIFRTLAIKNKTSLLNTILVENKRTKEEEIKKFKDFLSITEVHTFRSFIRKNNIKGIVLSSTFETYINQKNPILLKIIKSYQNESNKIIFFES
ncbi:MAG: hypothetical protein PWP03_427 [Candidatus Woesearchaeota archaeon]|nr:hypothetical protein [Candidatus Woesearchaeota archaeon]MDN5327789.1 hypothetical protein [Candidatus Woesearchaeota archaeon]